MNSQNAKLVEYSFTLSDQCFFGYRDSVQDKEKKLAIARNPIPTDSMLYHYTGRIDDDNLTRMLLGELFYFSNPTHFNDVLDLKMSVVPRKANENKPNFQIIATTDTTAGPVTGPVNAFEEMPGVTESLSIVLPDLQDKDLEKIRVFCTSETDTNNLMWSHYANRHQGVCVGLNWKKFRPPLIPYKVRYQTELSLTEYGESRFIWEAHPRARIKTTDWADEREWRLFFPTNMATDVVFVPLKNCVASITLGTKVQQPTLLKIFELKGRHRLPIDIFRISIVGRGLEKIKYHIDENFYSKAKNVTSEISKLSFATLFTGDIDKFLESLDSYLYHLLSDSQNFENLWHAIIAAANLSKNENLIDKVKLWAPSNLAHNITKLKNGNFGTPLDTVDIWEAYYALVSDEIINNNHYVFSYNSNIFDNHMSQEAQKLYLTLGYSLANNIEENEKHRLRSIWQSLCQSNVVIAKILDNKSDIEKCQSMLQRAQLTSS